MTLPLPIALEGAPGSPYTRKMLAVLRYRRIPYRFLIRGTSEPGLPRPKVELLPTFYLPDETGALQAVVDSTPIIRRLEREFEGRSLLPTDPVVRFVDELLEDFADEWLTKAMFHYRWNYAADIEKAGEILPRWRDISGPEDEAQRLKAQFSRRQISRLYVVGSNETTGPVIEAGYLRLLEVLEALFARDPFLMGRRPGASDVALYGQLTQLAHFDPTPAELTLARAKRVYAWVHLVDDLSGLEPAESQWRERDALESALGPLLEEVGRGYVPVMLANARALAGGAQRVECEVDGRAWVQQPFPYQGKCLQWLRASFAALSAPDRAFAQRLLERKGCAALVSAA
jgi:glutathione S-transferase